jgi:hypothetical protein
MGNSKAHLCAQPFVIFLLSLFIFAPPVSAEVETGKEVFGIKLVRGYEQTEKIIFYRDNYHIYKRIVRAPQFDSRYRFIGYETIDRTFGQLYVPALGRQPQIEKVITDENKHGRIEKIETILFTDETEERIGLIRDYFNIYSQIKRHVTYSFRRTAPDQPVMKYVYSWDRNVGVSTEDTFEYIDETRTTVLQSCNRRGDLAMATEPNPRWCKSF